MRMPQGHQIGLCKAAAGKDKSRDHLLLFKCTHILARIPDNSLEYANTDTLRQRPRSAQLLPANIEIPRQEGKETVNQ